MVELADTEVSKTSAGRRASSSLAAPTNPLRGKTQLEGSYDNQSIALCSCGLRQHALREPHRGDPDARYGLREAIAEERQGTQAAFRPVVRQDDQGADSPGGRQGRQLRPDTQDHRREN